MSGLYYCDLRKEEEEVREYKEFKALIDLYGADSSQVKEQEYKSTTRDIHHWDLEVSIRNGKAVFECLNKCPYEKCTAFESGFYPKKEVEVRNFGTIAHHFYGFTQEAINQELNNSEDYDNITDEAYEIRPIEILKPKIKNEIAQDYTALGYIRQNDYANKLKSEGYEVLCSFGNSKPDIVVLKNGVYQFVVSVKCFSLDKKRENGHTNSRTIQRKDTMPEINEAIRLNVPLRLAVCNLLNNNWEEKTISPYSFNYYSTSSEIANLDIITR